MQRNSKTSYRYGDATYTRGYTASSSSTISGISTGVSIVRVWATSNCFIKFGLSPVATTSDYPLIANTAEYLSCNPGEKVAAIRASTGADGTLYVSEMTL